MECARLGADLERLAGAVHGRAGRSELVAGKEFAASRRCSPGRGTAACPDYTMRGFALSSYGQNGALRSRLEGDVLVHYPDTDTLEVEGVRLRALDERGRVTLGMARRALSNGDGTQVRLSGNARVVREPGPDEAPSARVEIRGEFLELFTETERVRSHLPVTVVTERGETRAGNIDYNHNDRSGRLGGRVTGELRPVPR